MLDLIQELEAYQLGKGKGKIHFLRHKEEIDKALKAGYSSRAIWELLRQNHQMPIAYRQFHRYVRRYLKPEASQSASSSAPVEEMAAKSRASPGEPQRPEPTATQRGPRTYVPERKPLERNVHALSDQHLFNLNKENRS